MDMGLMGPTYALSGSTARAANRPPDAPPAPAARPRPALDPATAQVGGVDSEGGGSLAAVAALRPTGGCALPALYCSQPLTASRLRPCIALTAAHGRRHGPAVTVCALGKGGAACAPCDLGFYSLGGNMTVPTPACVACPGGWTTTTVGRYTCDGERPVC